VNHGTLHHFFEEECSAIARLMAMKNGEYAGEDDALGNFKRGAAINGITPLQVLNVYMTKHIDAVQTFIRDHAKGKVRPASEPIEGRFRDIAVYCLLAMALIQEEQEKNNADEVAEPAGDAGKYSDRVRPGASFADRPGDPIR
jgi:hypothetical protein